MKAFSSGPAFSGGSSGGSKKKHHKNRKHTGASKRKKRRERANSLASADGSVGSGGLSPSPAAQTSAVGRLTLSSSQSSSKATPAQMKVNGKHKGLNGGGVGGPSSSERLSFPAEESPAASSSFGASHRNNKKSKKNKSKGGSEKKKKKRGDEDTPTTTTTSSTRDTTPSRNSSSGSGKKHKHGGGGQIDQSASATFQHRHIDFVYPRGKSPFGKKKQGGEPELFVFSSQMKKQKKKDRAYSYDGSSDGDGEEKKMDRTDEDDDDDNDDFAFGGGGRRRPRANTEESIDDIFAKLTPAKSKKTKPKKEEEHATDTSASRKEVPGSHDADKSSGKEKKKRKRKRSMSAGSVDEAGISPSTASHVSSATKKTAKESSSEEEESQHEKKRRKKKESMKQSMGDTDQAQDMSGGARKKDAKARKEQRAVDDGDDGGLSHSSDRISHPAQLHRQLSGRSVEDAVRDKRGRRPRSNSTDRELNLPSGGLCDERGVLGWHKWDAERMYGSNGKKVTRLLRADPLGFVNKGNTCYLNATLQCLAHLPTFCQCVTELPENDRSDGQGGKGKRMTKLIRALLREAHRLDDEARGGHHRGYISPGAIVKNLKLLSSSNRGYKFRPGRQEDAHEFLVHLLDAMNDGELRAAGIDQNQSGWRDRLPFPRLDETTFIHRIFGGYLRSQVRCTRCNYKSNTYDPFLDLALEVNKKDSVEKAFRDFTRAETLDVDNQWKCSGCKKRVCAKKQLTVFRPPLSLVIQLKRFTFGGGGILGGIMPFGRGSGFGYGHFAGKGMGMKGRGGSKITKPIAFPKVLNLPLSDERLCVYELTGVVIHVGGSATSGHYTAYVKKVLADGTHQWFYLDDSHVEKVSEKTVLRQKHAYLLFYCRKEVTMELPSPPPRKSSMSGAEAKEAGEQRARARSDSLSSLTPSPPTSSKKKAASTPKAPSSSSALSASSSSASSSSSDESEDNANLKGTKKNLDASLSKADNSKPTASKRKHMDEPSLSFDDSDDSDDSSYSGSGSSSSFSFDSSDIEEHSDASSDGGGQSDSSDSSSSASSSSSEDAKDTEDDDRNKKTKQQATTAKKPKVATSTTGTGGNKIEVKVNRKKAKKAWQPSTLSPKERHNNSGRNDLLGNLNIGGWDDDEDDGAGTADRSDDEEYANTVVSSSMRRRQKAVQEMNAKEKSKKRKMYLDSWDAALDEGKQKKVKEPKEPDEYDDPSPGANRFQRIQEETQRMYQGKAKGYHGTPGPKMPRRKNRKTYGSRDNNRRRSSHF